MYAVVVVACGVTVAIVTVFSEISVVVVVSALFSAFTVTAETSVLTALTLSGTLKTDVMPKAIERTADIIFLVVIKISP